MTSVPFRTFALFGLALGMLATGYLFAPAPGASKSLPAQPVAKVVPPAPPKPETALVASRPPAPLVTAPRTTHFEMATTDSANKPAAGTANAGNPADPNAGKPATDTTQALAVPAGGNDNEAKRAIEFDGYRNVRGLEKGPDGTWRGRAMRGRTEVAVRVDATGNVSAE